MTGLPFATGPPRRANCGVVPCPSRSSCAVFFSMSYPKGLSRCAITGSLLLVYGIASHSSGNNQANQLHSHQRMPPHKRAFNPFQRTRTHSLSPLRPTHATPTASLVLYLASAGYRVWSPDQRGYNLSDKPDGLASYRLDVLAADVLGLIDAAGQKQVFLVGHDLGGSIAWWVATKYPDRLSKMVILNIPNGAVKIHLRGSFAQLRKLWYGLFFQIPWLPEYLSSRQNWSLLVQKQLRPINATTMGIYGIRQPTNCWFQLMCLSRGWRGLSSFTVMKSFGVIASVGGISRRTVNDVAVDASDEHVIARIGTTADEAFPR